MSVDLTALPPHVLALALVGADDVTADLVRAELERRRAVWATSHPDDLQT